MFFFPLVLILLAICLKHLFPFVFKRMGWRGRFDLVLEERVGAMLFLMCSAFFAGFAFWYPEYVATYHAYEDDRYGMIYMFAFPFYFIGAAISGVAFYRLARAVSRRERTGVDVVFVICGSMLALVGFSPLLMFGWRMLSSN
jgi:hypothetical protein